MPPTYTPLRNSFTSRLFETENDLLQMQGLLMEARSRTDDWHYPHIGDLIFWFFMVSCHLTPQEFIRLWHDNGGKLLGYAILGEDPSFDCQVLPEYEWCGIETEAIVWAETRQAELRNQNPIAWGGNFVSGVRQDNPKRIAFLEQHGYQPGKYVEVNLLRTLDGLIPEAVLPPACVVRSTAAVDDIPNRVSAQREVWHPYTVGNVSDEDYARFMQLPGYDRQLDVVAVAPDGVIAAYVNGWIDPVNRIGDFGPLGARPGYRRQGLTRAVLLECMRRMQRLGMNRVSVSTGVSNEAALRLYASVGFKPENKYLEYVKTV